MTTKTTDLWLSRDADGTYWRSHNEPAKWGLGPDTMTWRGDGEALLMWPSAFSPPALRKGTKRRIRVTVEVLR